MVGRGLAQRWSTDQDFRQRILLLLVPAFGLVLIGFLWWITLARLAAYEVTVIAAGLHESETIAATFEHRVLRAIREADRTMLLLRYLYERDGQVDIPMLVKQGIIPADSYLLASLVDRDGYVRSSTERAAVGVNVSDREYFQRHAAHDSGVVDVSRPTVLKVSGKTAIQLSRRISAADGSFAGMVVLAVDPAFLTDFYRDSGLGQLGILSLLGTDGVFRARRVGDAPVATPDNSGVSVLARAAEADTGLYENRSPLDGVTRLFAYRKLRDFPLIVVAAKAKQEALEHFRTEQKLTITAATIASSGIVLFCVVLLVLVRRLQAEARRELSTANELRLAAAVFESTADAVVLSDAQDRILAVNTAFTKLTGFAPGEVVGLTMDESPFRPIDPEQSQKRKARWQRDGYLTDEVTRIRRDGSLLYLWLTATCVRDSRGSVLNHVRVFSDISPLKQSQRKIEALARSDPLTGLTNRRGFLERLDQELQRARRDSSSLALLFVDLNGFKSINDTLGHGAGDAVLVEVAARLQRAVRGIDIVSRLGGDEFTLILSGALLQDRDEIVQRIESQLRVPIAVGGASVVVRAAIGVARYPGDATDAHELMKCADAAMYRAKQSGPSQRPTLLSFTGTGA